MMKSIKLTAIQNKKYKNKIIESTQLADHSDITCGLPVVRGHLVEKH
jgi:hypothetical protein